ncbi:hypothetical protein K0M31_019077 [Melipona bicolor]|uniref:Uncharacterized protein n=1 Tax=Melipona bicolor TaxID=60889 RepID=A0AA40KQS5_9HYME|nr:hypothetical protein K0M31_019077 [Melipona bicolor]
MVLHRDVTPTGGFYRVARTKLSADPEPGKRSRRIYALAQPVQEIASYFDSLIPLNVGIVELALSWNRPAVAFNPNTRGLKRAKVGREGGIASWKNEEKREKKRRSVNPCPGLCVAFQCTAW